MILDIAFGISLSAVVASLFGFEASFSWYALGVLFALLPDVDVFLSRMSLVMRKRGSGVGKYAHEHRDLLHYPILFVIMAVALYAIATPEIAILFAGAVFLHFAHDSVHIGWGIAWLWPYSKRTIKFFSNKKGPWSWNLVKTWSGTDLRHAAHEHGNDNWLKDYYFTLSPTVIFEVVALILSLVIAYMLA